MKRAVLLCALLANGPALAQGAADPTYVEENEGFVEEQWKESQVSLPAFPAEADLVEFYVGPTQTSRFFVDSSSLSVGQDGVIRYTLVTKTAGGATNVVHEGLRCATREKRLYAIGRADQTWTRSRRSEWARVGGGAGTISPVHDQLLKVYFCANGARVTRPEEAIALLKRGGFRSTDGY